MAADVSPWRGAARRPGDGGVRGGGKGGAAAAGRAQRPLPARRLRAHRGTAAAERVCASLFGFSTKNSYG